MERLFLTHGEINKIKEKYPGKIPVFVTRSLNDHDIPDIPRHRFLVPNTLSIGQFIWIIRKQIKLPPEKALFVFVNNTLPSSVTLLSEIYSIHKCHDGALRMIYTSENTFGDFNYFS